MKIYSIKEIIKASNDILKYKIPHKILNKENTRVKKKLSPKIKDKIINSQKNNFEKEKKYQNKEEPLLLKNEIPISINNKINSFNYKINIKPEVKNHMINELYHYLKKKVKKNTLKLIIDDQLELKNLKNKINLLKQIESKLKDNFESSKRDNEILQIKQKKLENENIEFKIYNESIHNNLDQANKNNTKLEIENKDLKIHKDKLDVENIDLKIDNDLLNDNISKITQGLERLDTENKDLKIEKDKLGLDNIDLKIDNDLLNDNISKITQGNERLDDENKELKNNLEEIKDNLNESNLKNRSYEINNSELKNTVSRYIVNSKKIEENLNLAEQSKNTKLVEQTDKVKFYQEENIRLSSELLIAKKKNETIKENLNVIETEKEKISNKIKELNQTIDVKSNIIPSSFIKSNEDMSEKKIDTLNDKEQQSLDEVINRIFAKI
mgnify:CR=1 FL=1|tara:strand:+ start:2424 stop:3743 length:1320 start_codon:yes stop_codon:yes gene_type:complete